MSGSAVSGAPSAGAVSSLRGAQRPRRVQSVLDQVLAQVAAALERAVSHTLTDVGGTLPHHPDPAARAAARTLATARDALLQRLRHGLADALARIDQPDAATAPGAGVAELQLMDDADLQLDLLQRELASRAELRHALPLHLLGQRFGVLGARPAYDASQLPVGPARLTALFLDALRPLALDVAVRTQLLQAFERSGTTLLAPLYDALNALFVRERILPTLASLVPIQARAGASARPAAAGGFRPSTQWPGSPAPTAGNEGGSDDEHAMLAMLQALLQARRSRQSGGAPAPAAGAVGVPVELVDRVLAELQRLPAAPVLVDGRPSPRRVTHLKQDLLARLRQHGSDGRPASLSATDSDAIDMAGLVLDRLAAGVRPNSPAATLLTRLQAPVLRLVLKDPGSLLRSGHPARALLDTLAEHGNFWTDDDDMDRAVIGRLQALVDRIAREFDGDPALFASTLAELAQTVQAQLRKAEVSERRHVEAARGRERLELARTQAREALAERLQDRHVPRYLQALLDQAWTDVLALAALRRGVDSDEFRADLDLAQVLIDATDRDTANARPALAPEAIAPLQDRIEQALLRVGYHGEDARAIADRLVAALGVTDVDDPASRTELALRLKARARLGQDVAGGTPAPEPSRAAPGPAEADALAQLRLLPFGTWLEVRLNEQGLTDRRRLSWFSAATDQCLLVNHRGQRVAEPSLTELAGALARGEVRIVEDAGGSAFERAWRDTLDALRGFAPASTDSPGAPTA